MDQIIANYLNKSLTLEEQHILSKWLNEDKRNVELLNNLERYWNNYPSDVEAEKKDVEHRILKELDELNPVKVHSKRNWKINIYQAYKVAAIFIVVVSTVIALFLNGNEHNNGKSHTYIEKQSLPGQNIITKLPDGTIVKLNSDSKLIVPESFEGDTREVRLIGEAFFEVTRNESMPFVVQTKNFCIKVLGTSFNVSAYSEIDADHIAVKTGKVSVKGRSKESVDLTPHQMVTVSSEGNLSEIIPVDDDLVFGWVDKHLVFKDNALDEVFNRIEHWYGVKIHRVDNLGLSDKLFNASFSKPNLNEVLTLLSKVYRLEYKIEDDTVLIMKAADK